jgi:aminopeptidase-like protein
MDSLVELLTISDIDDRIRSLNLYISNIKKYSSQMKAFLPVFDENWRLPIKNEKYSGKIAYIDWILRSDELFLNFNIVYHSTGLIKCCESLSQCLRLTEITDIRNVKTLFGRRFRKRFVYDKLNPVNVVLSDRVISPKVFAISDSGIEKFASRDRILKKFGLHLTLNDV